jgi:hypothetical protein
VTVVGQERDGRPDVEGGEAGGAPGAGEPVGDRRIPQVDALGEQAAGVVAVVPCAVPRAPEGDDMAAVVGGVLGTQVLADHLGRVIDVVDAPMAGRHLAHPRRFFVPGVARHAVHSCAAREDDATDALPRGGLKHIERRADIVGKKAVRRVLIQVDGMERSAVDHRVRTA